MKKYKALSKKDVSGRDHKYCLFQKLGVIFKTMRERSTAFGASL